MHKSQQDQVFTHVPSHVKFICHLPPSVVFLPFERGFELLLNACQATARSWLGQRQQKQKELLMSVADSVSVPMTSVGTFPLAARVSAVAPEGLAPVRAIFAHGAEEVSIKVSDEGGGGSERESEEMHCKTSCGKLSGKVLLFLGRCMRLRVDLFVLFHWNTFDLEAQGIPRSVPCLQLCGVQAYSL